MGKLVYTKDIKGGKLSLTKMEVGTSITGNFVRFEPTNYGYNNVVIAVKGKEVVVFTTKSIAQDLEEFGLEEGDFVEITRTPNRTTKNGYSMTTVSINVNADDSEDASSEGSPATKLAAIRAKRAQAENN